MSDRSNAASCASLSEALFIDPDKSEEETEKEEEENEQMEEEDKPEEKEEKTEEVPEKGEGQKERHEVIIDLPSDEEPEDVLEDEDQANSDSEDLEANLVRSGGEEDSEEGGEENLPDELSNLVNYANDRSRAASRSDLDRKGAIKISRKTAAHITDSLENLHSSESELRLTLAKWSIRTQPRMERLTTAILQDDRATLASYLEAHLSYKMRGLSLPVEINSRARHVIRSKAMSLGHLLVLFSTPHTLAYLEARKLLVNALFRVRCDFDVNYVAMDTKLGLEPSCEFRDSLKGVPVAFMSALRDNWPSLRWLVRKGFFRRHAVEVDAVGRNLLHFAVEEESPNLVREILNNRSIFPWEILRNMLKTRETVRDETPFARACSRADPSMMLLFVRSCPPDFVLGREDLSGQGKSVFNYVLSKLTNTNLSMQVVKEFLKRGAVPDHTTFDDTSCIESLISNEQFAGIELKRMMKLLLKYGAQPTNGALIKLLRLSFRTDEELFQLSKILLKTGGTRLLLSKQAYKLWSLHRKDTSLFKPFELASRDGKSVCIEILRNSSVTITKMERLLILISQYADISAMFPDADGMAVAIGERMGLDPTDEQYLDLESVLRLILRFALAYQVEEEIRAFLNRLQRGILRELFERIDSSRGEHGMDSSTAFVLRCLDVMESMEFDFNSLVDGQVGLFSVFHQNVPDEMVMKVLEALPKSFRVNTQDAMSENIGSLVIKRYSENFQTVRKIFELLKTMDFDFTQTVHGGQTLLMLYVSKCGERFDQMQTEDRMTAYVETDFFSVIRFLFRERVDMKYQVTGNDIKSNVTMNVLSVSMTLKHSNIAEEILKLNPRLLDVVPVETVLAFIKQCPQVLEFLNGLSLIEAEDQCPNAEEPEQEHVHSGRAFLKKNFNTRCTTAIRTTWLNYIQRNHEAMLRFVGEEEQEDFSKQVELIYDYLVHCDFVDEEDVDSVPLTVAMEFSVFRPELKQSRLPRKKEAMKERVNGRIFLKIVEECTPIVNHPLFTEYFEKFYRKAFVNSVAFLLFHMLFLGILISSLNLVQTHATLNTSSSTSYYICSPNGDYCRSLLEHSERHKTFNITCNNPKSNDTGCESCQLRTTNESFCPDGGVLRQCPMEPSEEYHPWIATSLYLLSAMGLTGLGREIVQMMLDRLDYFKSYMQNIVEVSMYVFVLLFAYNFGDCKWASGFKENWQFQIGTFAVLNSWFMMFFYMSKFPAFATYVIMFYRSVKSGLWLLTTFSSLILGFAFSFHFLLKNQAVYRTMPLSINKVWIMMAGEIDYKATFTLEKVPYMVLTRLLLFVFVLLISIVLANLFIGLIVGDVDKINKEAELKKWQWNLEFIEYTESMFDFVDKWIQRMKTCCRHKTGIRVLGQMERDRRSTVYLQQVDSGRRRLGATESIRHGLYVTDLSWRNAFKWGPLAKFFGFVDRKELNKRLMALEGRKLKLRKQYCALRRVIPQHIQKQNDTEIVKRKVLPCLDNIHNEEEEVSEAESGVTIHSVAPEKPKKSRAGLENQEMGSTDSLASVEELLPRHEREPVQNARHAMDDPNNQHPRTVMEAAARLGYMQFAMPGKIPRFMRVGQSGELFDSSSR